MPEVGEAGHLDGVVGVFHQALQVQLRVRGADVHPRAIWNYRSYGC